MLLPGALLALALPASAAAATVESDPNAVERILVVSATSGEANRMTIDFTRDAAVVDDTGAPLVAGAGCDQVSLSRVSCPYRAGDVIVDAFVNLGDQDDELELRYSQPRPRPWSVTVNAGDGDDLVRGGLGEERLHGGGGNDTLEGGDGDDLIEDGDETGQVGADVYDGGRGFDTAVYSRRTERVVVRLGRDRGHGQAGEGDVIRGVEGAWGGRGNDLLVGDNEDNEFRGGGGRDRLEGRRGDDTLDGQGNIDVVRGGSGNDTIQADERPVRTDSIGCGAGRGDRVLGTDPISLLAPDCETVFGVFPPFGSPFPINPKVDRRATRAVYRAPCMQIANGRRSRCSAEITLRTTRGRLLGRGRGSIATRPYRGTRIRFARFDVPVWLSSSATRTLRRRGRMTVRATVDARARVPGRNRGERSRETYTFVLTR